MELDVTIPGSKTKSKLQVSDHLFDCDFNETLVHQVVNAYLAGRRAGTKAQKTRSEVRGGGRKPWRQKGTGRARAGTIRSPIWRGGGVTFAAKPRDYSQKVNKKMFRAAMRSIFSELVRKGSLMIVESLEIKESKTKELCKTLETLNVKDAFIVTNDLNENLHLASRNIPNIEIRDVQGIDPVSLVNFDKVILTVEAVKQLEERLG